MLAGVGDIRTSVSTSAQSQAVDYEAFCKQDRASKELVLARLSNQDRAELARTQLERWVDANKPRLTPAQVAAVQDRIKAIERVDYSGAVVEQDMAPAKAFENSSVGFTQAELIEMSLAGPCMPRTK
jgi:hypothetical protein